MIDAESAGLQAEIEIAERVLSAGDHAAQLRSAEELLFEEALATWYESSPSQQPQRLSRTG